MGPQMADTSSLALLSQFSKYGFSGREIFVNQSKIQIQEFVREVDCQGLRKVVMERLPPVSGYGQKLYVYKNPKEFPPKDVTETIWLSL